MASQESLTAKDGTKLQEQQVASPKRGTPTLASPLDELKMKQQHQQRLPTLTPLVASQSASNLKENHEETLTETLKSEETPKVASSSNEAKDDQVSSLLIRRSVNSDDIIKLNLIKLYQEQQLVDCSLICEGRSINAHKLILSSASNYFKTAFTTSINNFNNSSSASSLSAILINDIKFNELKLVVDFIYEGQVELLDDKFGVTFENFLKAGHLLQVIGLLDATIVKRDASRLASPSLASPKERRQISASNHQMPNLILLPALTSALLSTPSPVISTKSGSPIICQALTSSATSGNIPSSNGTNYTNNGSVQKMNEEDDYSSSEEIDIQSLSESVEQKRRQQANGRSIKRQHHEVEYSSSEEEGAEDDAMDLRTPSSTNRRSNESCCSSVSSAILQRPQPKARDFYACNNNNNVNHQQHRLQRPQISASNPYYASSSSCSSAADVSVSMVASVPLKRGRSRPPRHSTDSVDANSSIPLLTTINRSASTPSHLTSVTDLTTLINNNNSIDRRYSDPITATSATSCDKLLMKTPTLASLQRPNTTILSERLLIDNNESASSLASKLSSGDAKYIFNYDPVPIMKHSNNNIGAKINNLNSNLFDANNGVCLSGVLSSVSSVSGERVRIAADGQTSSLRGRKPKLNYTNHRDASGKNKCPHCPQVYYSTQAMNDHINNVHSKNSHKYSCKICSKEFSWKISLNKHLRKLHGEEPNNKKLDPHESIASYLTADIRNSYRSMDNDMISHMSYVRDTYKV